MIDPLTDSELCELRQNTLSILMDSELLTSDPSSIGRGPSSVHYLLSLTQVALSATVDIPEFWTVPRPTDQILRCLLRFPDYEVRELVLQGLLRRLQEQEEQGQEEQGQEEEQEEQGQKDKEKKQEKSRPQWLDETTMSDLTGLGLHETHPQCLAKVGPHTHTHTRYVSFAVYVLGSAYMSGHFIGLCVCRDGVREDVCSRNL